MQLVPDLGPDSVGQADPLFNPALWSSRRELHLLTQFVGLGDDESEAGVPPQMVSVLEVPADLPGESIRSDSSGPDRN